MRAWREGYGSERTDTEAEEEKEGYGMGAQSPTQVSLARLLGLLIHGCRVVSKGVSRSEMLRLWGPLVVEIKHEDNCFDQNVSYTLAAPLLS